MQTLRGVLTNAKETRFAIGHFNISDSNQLNAIFVAAQGLQLPVIIGASEGERKFIGINNAVSLVKGLRSVHNYPIFLNADHTHDVDGCKEAIDAGFDAVMFDGSKLELEENISKTREVVEYARNSGKDVVVEGELGYIGSSSKLLDAPPEDMDTAMTDVETAVRFITETRADMLAPSVGNLHGLLKGREHPALDIERIRKISDSVNIPLVLHGGSGVSDEDFISAIKAGITIVHINTEIRVAYRKGIEEKLAANKEEIAPYRYLDGGVGGVKTVVENRLKLFNNL